MATELYFIQKIEQNIQNNTFIKLSLGDYKGTEVDLKNVYVRPVMIKRELKLSFVYRYQRKDITKNYTLAVGIELIGQMLAVDAFRIATLFIEEENLICQYQKNGQWGVRSEKILASKPVDMSHDHEKKRRLSPMNKRYLQELRLTDAEGHVYKNAQDKWKQINHYIDLLSTTLKDLPDKDRLQIADMGAGKGYLTFALYDYLVNELHRPAKVIGVEYRRDLVDLCNGIAEDSHMVDLRFQQGTIEAYVPESKLDMLIALHACDTATDDAIYKGIVHEARVIVVAPCCHKQIRKELESIKAKNELDFMIRHGIFLERHAEMLTDSIRALLLEYHGYQTKVVQFIADAHTPKNVMIIAVKKGIATTVQEEIRIKIESIKSYFGIGYHHLERLFVDDFSKNKHT